VRTLTVQLARHRFVTIVGPGGMGKTTVALAVAEGVAESYEDRVRFVDLAPITDPEVVLSALAAVLVLPAAPESRLARIHAFLADKQLLLVLDNCEHLADAAANLVEGILKAAPRVHVLATSREPLQAEAEWVSRLPSLETPARSAELSARSALAFPAVQLFVERASVDVFELSDADAPVVAEICRRLDGNPLAIELAASRAAALGVRGLATRLDARFFLLMKGRRTALPRHRTLHATLDWSYETLSEPERVVLRRLAVFKGNFSLESAVAVVCDSAIDESSVLDAVIDLNSKSLLVADTSRDSVRYRLLEITREYAAEKLATSGEREQLLRRHAEHYRDLFEQAEGVLQRQATDEWLAVYQWRIDDVRAALAWAFAPGGDMSVGVALTVSSVPLWFRASLIHEYRLLVEKALELVTAESPPDALREMRLSVALAPLLLHRVGPIAEMTCLVERALELSQGLAIPLRMQAISATWVAAVARADYAVALQLAEAFDRLCAGSSDLSSQLVRDRMMALPLYFLGRHDAARTYAMRVLGQPRTDLRLAYNAMSHLDQQVSVRTLFARNLWLQGFPEQALRVTSECLERALGLNHATSVCFALGLAACPIAIWSGEMETARRWVAMLVAEAARHSLSWWAAWGRAFEWVLALRHDDSAGAQPRSTPHELAAGAMQAELLCTFREELLDAETIARVEAGVVGWCAPEIARARGAVLLKQGGPEHAADAEALFAGALDLARQQGSLSWELRIAMSMARLWAGQGRSVAAHALLSAVYERFTEGFATADLTAAQALLSELEVG
jgi:predicted ATPase